MNSTGTVPAHTIRAVLFDYGMVLSGPQNIAAWTRMKVIGNLSEEGLQREYWLHRHPYDRGTHTGEAYWHLIAAGNGVTFSREQIQALIEADTDLWTDLNVPMVEWAQSLQRAGMRTGILSNLGDAMAAGVLAKFDWLGAFDHRTWSYSLLLAKPEEAIYRHAAEGLRTSPQHILFIDDRADNVEAAQNFGMQVLRYTTHAAFLAEMEGRGLTWLLHPEGVQA